MADISTAVVTVTSAPATRLDPLIVEVYDEDGLGHYELVADTFETSPRYVIFDSDENKFFHPYGGKSTVTGAGTLADPYIFTLHYRGGWPTDVEIQVDVRKVYALASDDTSPGLVIIAGQSNATGRGDVGTSDRGLDLASIFVNCLINQQTSDATTNPIVWDNTIATRTLRPYRVSGQPGVGVELSLGRYLYQYNGSGGQIPFLGKYAINGSALASYWLPSLGDDAAIPGTDNLFTQFVAYIRALEVESGFPLKAIVWIQGEADATVAAQAGAYETNMTAFVDALRTEFGAEFAFVINKLHVDCVEVYTPIVREAQRAFALNRSRVFLVDCDDIPLPVGDVHFAADSMASLGNRLAEVVAEALYPGRNTDRVASAAPFIQAINEPCARGVDALIPRIPPHEEGDDIYLVVVTGLANTPPVTPPGWTLEVSKQSITGGNYVNLYLYRKRASGPNTGFPTIDDTNALNVALCFTVRGAGATAIEAFTTSSNNAYNTTVNVPTVTTLGANRLALHIVAGYSGDPNIAFSGWTNGALTGLEENRDSSFNVNGGGDGLFIAVASGVKTAAGATGATTVTPSNISINAAISLSIGA